MRARDERGATLVEYAMLVALVAVVAIASISRLQEGSDDKVEARSGEIGLPAEENALNGPSGGGGGGGGGGDGGGGSGPVTAHVGGLSATSSQSGNDWSATVTITVVDEFGDPVQGASVTGSWSSGGGGTTCSPTSVTGQCTITSAVLQRTPPAGAVVSVTFTLSSISGADVTYDAGSNTSDQIVVPKP